MRILVTGANGQVGRELASAGPSRGHQVQGFDRTSLDITDINAVVEKITETCPDIVINAAAYTAVDKAETEKDNAFLVNCTGAENLALACKGAGIPLIHISTDYVFDGTKPTLYSENDPVRPANVYGQSKEAGERAVREILDRHIILRTSWVFSCHGSNFVKTMIRLARERDMLRIVADQHGGPTGASDIADAAISIAEEVLTRGNHVRGTYHYSGAPATTWHEFACAIISRAKHLTGKNPAVEPISTEEYPTPAARPRNSIMDCGKIFKVFGIKQPDWNSTLGQVISKLEVQDKRTK